MSNTKRKILYETHNLTLASGTGIATYARNLAEAAAGMGLEPWALFGVARNLSRKDERLNEILSFDSDPDEVPSFIDNAWRTVSALGGLHPARLPSTGIVIGTFADRLRPFSEVYAITRMVEISALYFKTFRTAAQVRLPETPDIFHATHAIPLAVKGAANIYTIHDLVPLRLPYTTRDDKKYLYKLYSHLAKTADQIVTVSEHSRRDIVELLGVDERRVTNTYQAIEIPENILLREDEELEEDLRRYFDLGLREYFLFSGAIEPKKNISNLIDAYAASGTSLPLIVAGGGGWMNRDELKKIRDERFASFRISDGGLRQVRQVRRLPYLPRDQLLTLIKGAKALLFPSIYEGFGLPVIEAMALGTPVITSNVSSLPEVAGDSALLVNPHSVEEISRAISAVEHDADLRLELSTRGRIHARKFSRAAYAERLATLYSQL
jgi:glycosyltransferase involved in cell wall biosynthesis